MSIFSKLSTHVTLSFSYTKITKAAIEKGLVTSLALPPVENSDGTYLGRFIMTVDGDTINYDYNGKQITKPKLSFEVQLNDCEYCTENGWSWNTENGYKISAKIDEPNFVMYSGDEPLNGTGTGIRHIDDFTEKDDSDLAYQKAMQIMSRSKTRLELFKDIIADLDFELTV